MAESAESVASHASRGLRICPFLGLAVDPETAAAYARSDHQCGLSGVGRPALTWQTHYCLATEYVECPHFQQAGEAPDFETAATANPPVPQRRRYGRRSWRMLPLPGLVVIAAVIVMCGLGAAYSAHVGPWSDVSREAEYSGYTSSRLPSSLGGGTVAGQSLSHPYASVAGVATPPLISPTATVGPQPTSTIAEPPEALAESQPTPVIAGVPGIVPGPQSTAPPPAPPVPKATPTQVKPKPTPTYTVQTGDTLTSIAQRFHTTIDAIVGLNKISDPNFILAGLVLKLPPTKAGTPPTHSP